MALVVLIIVILSLIASVVLITWSTVPTLFDGFKIWQRKKEKSMEIEMDKQFYYEKSPRQIVRLYFILPPVLGIAGVVLLGSPLFIIIGVAAGLLIPNMLLRMREARRRQKFSDQLLDAIMILSSSLKGGLSLLQALEVLADEMAVPMCQEIGLIVRENKMGVTLEESLKGLNKRMALEELNLVVNSILVARETGGDLTKVLSRLSTTIRDNKKLKDSVRTLTLQGRLQGIIMSALPFVFIWWVVSFNREHFDIMLKSEIGRSLLLLAVVLQAVGMVLIRKFSTIKI